MPRGSDHTLPRSEVCYTAASCIARLSSSIKVEATQTCTHFTSITCKHGRPPLVPCYRRLEGSV